MDLVFRLAGKPLYAAGSESPWKAPSVQFLERVVGRLHSVVFENKDVRVVQRTEVSALQSQLFKALEIAPLYDSYLV